MTTLPNRAEIDLRCRSQKGKTIGFTLSMVPGPDGTPEGAAIFFKDLTYVEHREEQERLRDRLAALGQMAANLAHEIRNPLASIEVTCSLLKRKLPPEPAARDLLDKIVAEVRRLNRTITSSLEFVRPLSLTLASARLEPVLDEAITVALGRRGRPEIRVERRYAAALPPFLMDPAQVRQVFENLLINAMEAMGDRGTVTVESDVSLAPAAASIPYRPWAPRLDRYVVVRCARRRGSRGSPGQAVLPLLHDQEARLGCRTVHGSQDRGLPPWAHRRRKPAGPGGDLHRAPPHGPGRRGRNPMKKILVAEDEPTLREGIVTAFRDRGWQVTEAADGAEAMERLENEVFDVLVTDYKMPHRTGLDVLKRSKMINEGTVAVVMTAYGTVESAVEAMKAGAYDYVLKPFELEELELKVERALEHRRLLARLAAYDRQTLIPTFENIVGESPQMKEIFRTIEKVAHSNATVMVLGETGVGKELVAEALHSNSSRSNRAFVKMNCAALHESLLESELFGHGQGAFTGADRQRTRRFAGQRGHPLPGRDRQHDAGHAGGCCACAGREFERLGGSKTIKVDVRLVAATNKNLEEAIGRGEFREDLFYRLNVVSVTVPPLRERKEDIVPLAKHFIDRFAAELKKDVRGIEPSAVRVLKRHTWPGNIRELQNTIERSVLMCDGASITPEDLSIFGGHGPSEDNVASLNLRLPPSGIQLDELEKQAILEALRISNWVQKDAAAFLGISSRVMNYKVAKYEIKSPRWTKNKQVS